MIGNRSTPALVRKIIHVDMDCFYAAIEIRDNPSLADKPVAVGGLPSKRGVICTCNYIARQYGLHSAMSTATAYRHCPSLYLLPVNMVKYKEVARKIYTIFREFTDIVEPLSLDEAYLDVTDAAHYHGSATFIAEAIRERIWKEEKLTASAGVASNKFLAKIASGWKKPNGLFVIYPKDIATFIKTLPVDKMYGVGKVTAKKLHTMRLKTCTDLQKLSLSELIHQFGKRGKDLYEQCRGIDNRPVDPNKVRKSLSVEQTFQKDITDIDVCLDAIHALHHKLIARLQESALNDSIKSQYIKIKFSDFKLTTAEITNSVIDLQEYITLFRNSYAKEKRSVRLLGVGVRFQEKLKTQFLQQSLF